MVGGFNLVNCIGGHVSLSMCIVNEIGGFNFLANGEKLPNSPK